MNILLTGGSGDLGSLLAKQLENIHIIKRLDIVSPKDSHGIYLQGSILDREKLKEVFNNIDCIVHIAGWHGIHEFKQEKNVYDFWELNVNGTFNVFQIAAEMNIQKIVYISSESISDIYGLYGNSKIIGETLAEAYSHRHKMNVITLRPRGFIPHWNRNVYLTYVDWAKWFWQGCVHITDVAQAVEKSIDYINQEKHLPYVALPVDGAYEYTSEDLRHWDEQGKYSTFKKYYEKYFELAIKHGLDPSLKPTVQDIEKTSKLIGYSPRYSLMSLLQELETQGEHGSR